MAGSSWILVLTLNKSELVGDSHNRETGVVHIDGGECAVGDGATQCTSNGESRVEVETLGLLGHRSSSDGSHCEVGGEREKQHGEMTGGVEDEFLSEIAPCSRGSNHTKSDDSRACCALNWITWMFGIHWNSLVI